MTVRTRGEASVFVSYGGPWRFVCAGMDDITLPAGDLTTVYKPAPEYGEWEPARIIRGAPGNITTTLRLRLVTPRETLQQFRDAPGIIGRVNFSTAGARDDPSNYNSAIFLSGGIVGDITISAPASLEPTTDVIEATVNLAFTSVTLWDPPAVRVISNQQMLMVGAEPPRHGTACEGEISCLERLYAISDGTTPAFRMSVDGGSSWTSTALSFTPTFVTKSIRHYYVGGTGGTEDPAVIGRSADGVNFDVIQLSSSDGARVTGIVRHGSWLYAVTDDGRIHASTDGTSWAVVYTGVAPLRALVSGDDWVVAAGSNGAVVYGLENRFSGITVGTQNYISATTSWQRNFLLLQDNGQVVIWGPGRPSATVIIDTTTPPNSLATVNNVITIAPKADGIYITEDGGYTWQLLAGTVGGTNAVASPGCDSWLLAGSNVKVVEPTKRIC